MLGKSMGAGVVACVFVVLFLLGSLGDLQSKAQNRTLDKEEGIADLITLINLLSSLPLIYIYIHLISLFHSVIGF
jgi:hypothetical protein